MAVYKKALPQIVLAPNCRQGSRLVEGNTLEVNFLNSMQASEMK